MKLLLLSNSRNPGQKYLEHAREPISAMLGERVKNVAFVPYAGVTIPHDQYAETVGKVFESIGYRIRPVDTSAAAKEIVENADAIAVGGGNTFRLLQQLIETGLLDIIRQRVRDGVPYMGWSAGSNVACPTIQTTNDMPIVRPSSFAATGLVGFQINPHYLDKNPEGHQGETREDRINEFIELNRDVMVAGLREGSALHVDGDQIRLLGDKTMRLFRYGSEPREVGGNDDLRCLISGS